MTPRDPAAMTAEERIGEIAAIFAVAYARLVLNREKRLDPSAESVALMTGAVDGHEADREEDA